MGLVELKYSELKYTAKTLRANKNKGKYQQEHGGVGGEYCGGHY